MGYVFKWRWEIFWLIVVSLIVYVLNEVTTWTNIEDWGEELRALVAGSAKMIAVLILAILAPVIKALREIVFGSDSSPPA